MTTPLRRLLAASALVLAAPVLTACGFNVQTDQVYQPAVGVDDRSASVDVLNAVVVTAKDGEGVFITTFVNNEQDTAQTVQTITSEGNQPFAFDATIPAGGYLNLTDDKKVVPVTGADVAPGKFVKVTIEFDSGEQVVVNAPVVAAEGDYAGIHGLTSPPRTDNPTPVNTEAEGA